MLWILTLLVLLAAALAYALTARPWEPKPLAVAVEAVEPGTISQVLAVNGRVAPRLQVKVRSAVSAQAIAVLADEGDRVMRGQVIVRLDPAQPQALVSQARAALEAGLVAEQQAQATLDRARALGENTPRATREDAERALVSASNEVARLRSVLDQTESQLAQYTITAPLSGVVLERTIDQGQLVDTQSELFTIADLSTLVVETDVDEIYSARMRAGLRAILKPAGDTTTRTGSVSFAAPTVDPSTGGRAIRIAFDEPVSLPVGLTVSANIIVSEAPSALSVPRGAIISEGGESSVLVIEDGVAVRRGVGFEDWPAERVVVTSGLAAGTWSSSNRSQCARGRPSSWRSRPCRTASRSPCAILPPARRRPVC
jgi:membrane fusion protein, multidrug efflux system